MITQAFENNQIASQEAYQMVKDEHLASTVISHHQLAGSRFLRSSYRQVVFSDCSFYSSEFQGVTFENCIFEGCNFKFLHIRNCKFINCSFVNCNWTACSTTISVYKDCILDLTLAQMTSNTSNEVTSSAREDYTTDIYIENLLMAA